MTYDDISASGLDYRTCRYGTSKLSFRGPPHPLDGDYVAVIGGTETYGKFVERPYPDLLQDRLGLPVVNFGAVNAGVDVFSTDDTVLSACSRARAVVVQVMGAHNLRNRYYLVHQRRNDRFLRASSLLKCLYPQVDFTEFHFTRHLIGTLRDIDCDRFAAIETELRTAWRSRMETLLSAISAPVVLLWLADRRPSEPTDLDRTTDPLFVNDMMLDALGARIAGVVEAIQGHMADDAGQRGVVFSGLEAPAAAVVPNAAVHEEAARVIADAVRAFV